jgi:hypothetical protein
MGFAGSFGSAADALEPFFASAMEPLKNFGQRIGDAIKNSMSGNERDLIDIGVTIGNLVRDGIMAVIENLGYQMGAGLWRSIEKLGSMITPESLQTPYDDTMAAKSTKAANELLKMSIEDLARSMEEAAMELSNPENNPNRVIINGNAYQPIRGGMQGADLWKDGQAYRLLERIANNTQPSPL